MKEEKKKDKLQKPGNTNLHFYLGLLKKKIDNTIKTSSFVRDSFNVQHTLFMHKVSCVIFLSLLIVQTRSKGAVENVHILISKQISCNGFI